MVYLNITSEQHQLILDSLIDTYNDCISDYFDDSSYQHGLEIQNLLIQKFSQPIDCFNFFTDFELVR